MHKISAGDREVLTCIREKNGSKEAEVRRMCLRDRNKYNLGRIQGMCDSKEKMRLKFGLDFKEFIFSFFELGNCK